MVEIGLVLVVEEVCGESNYDRRMIETVDWPKKNQQCIIPM